MVSLTIMGETTRAAGNHPFYVVRGRELAQRPCPQHVAAETPLSNVPGRWVDAIDLQLDDVVLTRYHGEQTITAVVVEPAQCSVYNLTVSGLHCYAISYAEVLVHNVQSCNGYIDLSDLSEEARVQRLLRELTLDPDEQRRILRELLGTEGTGLVSHHLIPLEAIKLFPELVQRAAKGGFDMNGFVNGYAILKDLHVGNHPGYSDIVFVALRRLQARSKHLSDRDIASIFSQYANELRQLADEDILTPYF